jgi:hypothetical protein
MPRPFDPQDMVRPASRYRLASLRTESLPKRLNQILLPQPNTQGAKGLQIEAGIF